MPLRLRSIAYKLPQAIATESLRCIMYRGWGVKEYEVRLGFFLTIGWAAFFLMLAIILFRRRSDR